MPKPPKPPKRRVHSRRTERSATTIAANSAALDAAAQRVGTTLHPARLHAIRKLLGLHQSDLASLLGLHARTIQNMETGRATIPASISLALAFLLAQDEHKRNTLLCAANSALRATSEILAPRSPEAEALSASDLLIFLFQQTLRVWYANRKFRSLRTTGEADALLAERLRVSRTTLARWRMGSAVPAPHEIESVLAAMAQVELSGLLGSDAEAETQEQPQEQEQLPGDEESEFASLAQEIRAAEARDRGHLAQIHAAVAASRGGRLEEVLGNPLEEEDVADWAGGLGVIPQ